MDHITQFEALIGWKLHRFGDWILAEDPGLRWWQRVADFTPRRLATLTAMIHERGVSVDDAYEHFRDTVEAVDEHEVPAAVVAKARQKLGLDPGEDVELML